MNFYAVIDTNVVVSAISQESIESLLSDIIARGRFIDAKDFEDALPDPKDKIFYCVLMTAREDVDAYLVTGNLKHFPIKPFVVTPRVGR